MCAPALAATTSQNEPRTRPAAPPGRGTPTLAPPEARAPTLAPPEARSAAYSESAPKAVNHPGPAGAPRRWSRPSRSPARRRSGSSSAALSLSESLNRAKHEAWSTSSLMHKIIEAKHASAAKAPASGAPRQQRPNAHETVAPAVAHNAARARRGSRRQSGSGSGSGSGPGYSYGYDRPTPLQVVSAGSGSAPSVSKVIVDVKNWDLAPPDTVSGAPTDMTMKIAAFTIHFDSAIAMKVQLPETIPPPMAYRPNMREMAEDWGDLSSWHNQAKTMTDFSDFDTTGLGLPIGMDLLSWLADPYMGLGHEIRVQCGSEDYTGDQGYQSVMAYLIPPVDNAVPVFLSKMEAGTGSKKATLVLFPDAVWHTDKLVVVLPFSPGEDIPDLAACAVSVGDSMSAVSASPSECTVRELNTFNTLVQPFLATLGQASQREEFEQQLGALSLIRMIDGFDRCSALLESMLIMKPVEALIAGRRACPVDKAYGTEAWKDDPCCNPAKEFEQCCALASVKSVKTVIESVAPSDQCDASLEEQLNGVLLGYQAVYKMRNDPVEGCAAERKKVTSPQRMVELFGFMEKCEQTLREGKTKTGSESCTSDSECYTRCVLRDGQNKKCSEPYEAYSSAFIDCSLDHMDPMALNFLRKRLGVSAMEPVQKLKDKVRRSYAEETCIGPNADGAACMLDGLSRDACTNNVFNKEYFRDAYVDPWAGTVVGVYVDRDQTESSCTSKYLSGKIKMWNYADQIEEDRTGACLCEPAQDSNTCTQADIDLTSIDAISDFLHATPSDGDMGRQYYGGGHGVGLLRTKWLADAPTGAGCRIQGFTTYTPDEFDTLSIEGSRGDAICTALGKTIADMNGFDWPDPTRVTGYVHPFSPTHEWKYSEDGSWDYVKTSEGSREWCEYEKSCNHLDPWHPDAADEDKCVAQYQTGGDKAHLGMSFCAQCDGPTCWQISQEPMCELQMYDDAEGACEDAGGVQVVDDWGYPRCQIAGFDGSEGSCFDLGVCPKHVESYTDWAGIERSYVSYGFCEWAPFCYDASSSSRGECAARGGKWYTKEAPQAGGGRRRGKQPALRVAALQDEMATGRKRRTSEAGKTFRSPGDRRRQPSGSKAGAARWRQGKQLSEAALPQKQGGAPKSPWILSWLESHRQASPQTPAAPAVETGPKRKAATGRSRNKGQARSGYHEEKRSGEALGRQRVREMAKETRSAQRAADRLHNVNLRQKDDNCESDPAW